MSTSIYIHVNNGDSAKVFASISSANYTNYSWDATNKRAILTYDNGDGISPTVKFLGYNNPNTGTVQRFANSLALEISWGAANHGQTVVIGISNPSSSNLPYKGATWIYNGTTLTPSNSFTVSPGGTIEVVGQRASSMPTTSNQASDVNIAGYWIAGSGSIDGQSPNYMGTFGDPVKWPSNTQVTNYQMSLGWNRPASNTSDILYYIVVAWKGTFSTPGSVANSFICGPNSTSVYDTTRWWDGNPDHKLLYTVHPVYNSLGMVPTLESGSAACIAQTLPSYGIYRQFAVNGCDFITVRYFNYNNGSPVIFNTSDGPAEYNLLKNRSRLDKMIPREVCPPPGSGLVVEKYYKRTNLTSPFPTTAYSESQLSTASVNTDVAAVMKLPLVTINFDPNGGTVDERSREVTIGEPIGTLPIPTYIGYDFNGWYTERTGGQRISENTLAPDVETTYYARWSEDWDVDVSGITFLHHERPSVKIALKRDSLQNPTSAQLVVKPTLCVLENEQGEDVNYLHKVRRVEYREEKRRQGWVNTVDSNGKVLLDSPSNATRAYVQRPDGQDNTWNDIKPKSDKALLAGYLRASATGNDISFDPNKEYQFRATIVDALEISSKVEATVRSTTTLPSTEDPDATKMYKSGSDIIKIMNGNTLGLPYNWTESEWSNTALMLKYVTKLFVHNPYMFDKIKESGRIDRNDTDYWQLRDHIQDSKLTRNEVLDSNNNPILKRRSDPRSVNGFSRDEIDKLIIPTLRRNLAEADLGERLVFDFSQEEKLIALIQRINDALTKTANEIFGFGGITDYKYNDYFDLLTVGKYEDQHKYEQRILDADGERHGTTNNAWVTESDTPFNRVVDTPYKKVVLKDFSDEQRTETLDTNVKIVSTIDHIYDYDISLIDLERSLSDWLYILYRMIERQEGDEGANSSDFNNPSADRTTLISTYRNANNTAWKSNAFRNWDGTNWLKPENDIAEYQAGVGDGWDIIKNSTNNPGAFDNNGCKAACMGLCQSGCYSSCVGNCKTACGTSCFFTCSGGCGSSCSSDCTSSCAQNCSTDCINSCTGNCSGSCTDSCQGTCGGSCTGGCGGTCKGTCSSTCSGGCTGTAACTDGCSSSCAQQCATGCTGSCSGSCTNGCGTTCSGGCKGNCTNGCNQGCSKGCGGGCSGQCEKTCSGTCDSSCLGTCRERCVGGCERYCQDTCRGTCKVNCGNNCTGSCVSNCAFSCVGSCNSTCNSKCSNQCYNTCKDDCKRGCAGSCGGECTDSCYNTCSQACQNSCGVGCDTQCAANCMNTCSSSCGKNCQGTCSDGCKGTCQEQCAEQCGNNCNATCGQSCKAGCGNTCTGTCGYSCWATCSTDCQGSAKLLVGKP